MNKIIKTLNLFIICLIVLSNRSNGEIDTNRQKEINFASNKFRYMLETTEQYYYDTLNLEAVTDAAFKTLLNSLDIQSVYYPKADFQKLQEQNKGEAEGIGIEIVPLSDTLTIIKILSDSPADSAGLLPGDKILFIDGKSVIGFTKSGGDSLVKGLPGTNVNMIVRRQYGSSLLHEYSVMRSEYNLPSINSFFMLDDGKTGYIQLLRFSSKSDTEIIEALTQLKKQGMKELIIDLRGNLGGVLTATMNTLDYFLPANTELLKVRGKHNSIDTVYYSMKEGKFQDLDLIILVDRNSASASEIFAGVVQDYDRGIIVGEKTFAKGTVQRIWRMTDGTGFRITIAEYETPSGRRIQKPSDSLSLTMLDPAFELNTSPEQREKIIRQINEYGGKSYLKTSFTKNGRLLISSGGITPDITAKSDTVNLLTRVLMQRGIFLEFIYDYLYSQKESILKKYKNDYRKFEKEFTIEDTFLEEFKKFSVRRNVWNDNYYAQDKEYFRDYLKALIAYTLWDEQGFKYSMIKRDKVLREALNTLPEYNAILKKSSH